MVFEHAHTRPLLPSESVRYGVRSVGGRSRPFSRPSPRVRFIDGFSILGVYRGGYRVERPCILDTHDNFVAGWRRVEPPPPRHDELVDSDVYADALEPCGLWLRRRRHRLRPRGGASPRDPLMQNL